MRPVEGARTRKLFDVKCTICCAQREEFLYEAGDRMDIDCPGCGCVTVHERVWAIQSTYTWRDPDSPSQRGKPTCVIGEH